MKAIICIFGVNGVGKSSILKALKHFDPGIIIFNGSSILKESLGVASYRELEARSSEEKKAAYLRGVASATESIQQGVVIIDTHLVVPIWGAQTRTTEDMWDDSLRGVIDGFVYITGSPATVSERRTRDLENDLRVRRCDELSCARDLTDNDARWDSVSSGCKNAWVIVNDTTIERAAKKLWACIQATQQK